MFFPGKTTKTTYVWGDEKGFRKNNDRFLGRKYKLTSTMMGNETNKESEKCKCEGPAPSHPVDIKCGAENAEREREKEREQRETGWAAKDET
jgi:hypothetical protein